MQFKIFYFHLFPLLFCKLYLRNCEYYTDFFTVSYTIR